MLHPALNKLQSVKMWHGEKLQPWSSRAGKRDRFSPLESPQKKRVRRSKEISGSFDVKENMFTNEV